MKRLAIISIVFVSMLAESQSPQSGGLTRIGGIAGENGTFGSVNRLVAMYSDVNIRVQVGNSEKWQLVDHTDSVSYEVTSNDMRRSQDNVPVAVAHDYQFCDPLNQVDISATVDKELSRALPKGAKVKAVENLGRGVFLVAFAASEQPVRYEIRLALLRNSTGGKFKRLDMDTVSVDGSYCGMQTLVEGYRAIFVNEPAGSSDSSAAYFYHVTP
jgi:hypothetical protein